MYEMNIQIQPLLWDRYFFFSLKFIFILIYLFNVYFLFCFISFWFFFFWFFLYRYFLSMTKYKYELSLVTTLEKKVVHWFIRNFSQMFLFRVYTQTDFVYYPLPSHRFLLFNHFLLNIFFLSPVSLYIYKLWSHCK